MIQAFHIKNNLDLYDLLDFIKKETDHDFYYTKDNSRIYISDRYKLKEFLKNSESVYVYEKNGDYLGLVLVWKSVGGGKERYYIKIRAASIDIAKDLLTVLVWNTRRDLSVKIRKDNRFVPVFRNKGFRFMGGRGIQILLNYKPQKEKKNYATANNLE